MNNNWNPNTIKVSELEKKMKSGQIAVPTYQRGVVWSQQQQKDLIDSIKKGYPFGSLIIFNHCKQGEPLLLIDGLQRSTSLFRFVNNPTDFFDEVDISDDNVEKIAVELGWDNPSETLIKDIKEKMVECAKTLKGSDSIKNMDVYNCASFLANTFRYPSKNPNDFTFLTNLKNIIDPTFNEFKNICTSIIDREIPYIEITGSDKELHTIFFRINDKGKKLTKENIFAATWANKSIKIVNPKLDEFIKIITDRYDSIESDGTSIYGYDHKKFKEEKELDVFEICHAFGKYIKGEYPELFGKINDTNKSEPIGFTLLNACLLGTKDTLESMNELLFDTFSDDNEINSFISKILVVIKYVDDLLAPYIKFKSNKRIGGKPLHTDFQICSIIASIFRLKHVKEDNGIKKFNLSSTNIDWNFNDKLLRKNLIKRYLSDSLNNIWSGHGDNTLDNIIHNNYDYYTREIKKDDLEFTLRNWFNMYKVNNKEMIEKDIKSPSNSDKIIMNIIYSSTFTAKMQLNEDKFDIEHLFPKKLAERILSKYKGKLKLPLSSIGNLCLLPEYTNRKKKDKTIYEDIEYTSKVSKKNISIKDLENNYTFTSLNDLSWVNDNMTLNECEMNYNSFINSRFEKILEMVIDNLYEN